MVGWPYKAGHHVSQGPPSPQHCSVILRIQHAVVLMAEICDSKRGQVHSRMSREERQGVWRGHMQLSCALSVPGGPYRAPSVQATARYMHIAADQGPLEM